MQRVNVHRGSWTQTCLLVIDISLPVVLSRLQSLIAFPKVKRQVLLCDPEAKQPKDFTDNTMFWVNQEFGIMWVELFVSQLHSVLETSYSVFCKIMINVELFVKELLFLELLYWNLRVQDQGEDQRRPGKRLYVRTVKHVSWIKRMPWIVANGERW